MTARHFSRLLMPSMLAAAACVALAACSGGTSLAPTGNAQVAAGSHALSLSSLAKNASSNTWTHGAPAPTNQFTGAATAVGSKIYLMGGENKNGILNENDVYDTTTNKWSRARRMPTARATLAVAAVNGIVYAIGGGSVSGVPMSTVEAYDTASNTWSTKASLPVAVDSMTATVDNGLIYVVGGLDNNQGQAFNGVQVYDPNADAWSPAAPMIVAKAFAYTATVGTQIVAAAGFVGNGPTVDNEVYDPGSNAWMQKHAALLSRYAGCTASIDGLMYVAGGLKFSPIRSAAKELDVYNAATDQWLKRRPMRVGVIGPASAVVAGKLYCIGGSPRYGQPIFTGRVQIYQP